MTRFVLDDRLAADTHLIGDLPLSRLLLMNDDRYPWVILVPRVDAAREVIDLDQQQQAQLWLESAQVALALRERWSGDKLNIGTLGNLVPQLHVHHVMRGVDDPAWPGPVWGHSPAKPYSKKMLDDTLARWREVLPSML